MSRNPDDTAVAIKTCMIFKVVRPVRKAKAAMSHCGIDGEEVMEIRTNTESCIAVITVRGRSPSAVMTSNTARGVSSYFHYF